MASETNNSAIGTDHHLPCSFTNTNNYTNPMNPSAKQDILNNALLLQRQARKRKSVHTSTASPLDAGGPDTIQVTSARTFLQRINQQSKRLSHANTLPSSLIDSNILLTPNINPDNSSNISKKPNKAKDNYHILNSCATPSAGKKRKRAPPLSPLLQILNPTITRTTGHSSRYAPISHNAWHNSAQNHADANEP